MSSYKEFGPEDEDGEFYEEWLNRDYEIQDMSYEEYESYRSIEEYGCTDEELDSGDADDS